MSQLNSVWTGKVTDTSIWVRAEAQAITTLELLIADNPDYTGAVVHPTPVPNAADVYDWDVTGLQPGTRYWHRVDRDGLPGDNWTGTFRTLPAAAGERASYIVGAAGDAGLTGEGDDSYITGAVSNNPVFDTMRAQGLTEDWAWFSHLGDLHYKNIAVNDVAAFRSAYFETLNYGPLITAHASQGTFYRHCPITYTWDDHDFGANNSNRTSASNPAANQVYREQAPHYDIPVTTGIYQSWQAGRVLYIASDCRSFRDPNSDPAGPAKTMLGTTQKTWMENLLTTNASGAEALVWITSSRWLAPDGPTGDTWNSFTDERTELIDMFGDLGWLDRMIQLTADKHNLSICSGPHNPHGGFPIFMFASLDSSYGSPDPLYDVGSIAGRQQYGTVTVRDEGHTIALDGTGWINGSIWKSLTKQIQVSSPVLALDYAAGHISEPFEPNEDDQGTVNDATASRTDGGEARVTLDEGPLSVQAPPDGAGVYDQGVTLQVAADEQLPSQAGWRVHLGTVDEARYPTIHVDLAANPELGTQAAQVESGDRVTIANPPEGQPPDVIEAMTEGGTELLGAFDWDITLNASPGSPWIVGQLPDGDETTAEPDRPNRLDTSGSELAAAIDADDTTLYVHTPPDGVHDRAVWVPSAGPGATFPNDLPFDVRLGGETARVTGVEPAGWDTFTRTVADGWGTSTAGHAWTSTNQPASDRSVNATQGVITLPANRNLIRFQRYPLTLGDCEVLVKMSVDQVATGGSILPCVLLRYVDTSTFYKARVHFGTAGTMFVSVTRDVTTIGASETLRWTYTAGQEFWVRVRLIGHRILMRVWPVAVATEPRAWHLDRTVNIAPLVDSGEAGIAGFAVTANTNVNPQLRFDAFETITPQRLTVTRALNGVTKAHPAAAPVSLAQPMTLAL